MLVTARVADGDPDGRSVVGHVTSADLETWTVGPPLSSPAGFGQLEVPQVVDVDGQPFLFFCCWPDRTAADRRASWKGGGMWAAPGDSLLGPWDLSEARVFDHPSLYAARLVRDGDGWALVGFRDTEDGAFVGEITDPIPVVREGRVLRAA